MFSPQVLASFRNEIEKVARRSYMKDFAAGVDPTGTATSSYGIRDAGASDSEARRRRLTGTLGGFVSGAALIPAVVGGTIEGVKGVARGGLRQGLRSAIKGTTMPYKQLYQARIGGKGLKAMSESGRALSKKELNALHGLAGAQGLPVDRLPSAQAMMKGQREAIGRGALKSQRARQEVGELSKIVNEKGTEAAAGLGLSGAIGAGSAYLQYGKGRELGKHMTAEQRAKATKGDVKDVA